MLLNHIILALVWLLYGFLHSVLADDRVKKWFADRTGKLFRFYRLYYNLFSLLALVAILWYQGQIRSPRIFTSTTTTILVGAIIAGAGILLMLLSIRKYFSDLSGLYTEENGETVQPLHISGIHQYVRHPLYLGTFAFIWGGWLVFPYWSILVMNLAITLYTLVGIGLEEKKLEKRFGQVYRNYRRQVPLIFPKWIK